MQMTSRNWKDKGTDSPQSHQKECHTAHTLKLELKNFNNFLMFIFERERERESEREGGRERGIHRVWSRLQALSCPHRAQCGDGTQELWNHDLSQIWKLNRLSHPGAPNFFCLFQTSEGERERENMSGRGRERGTHRIWCRLQALNCQHKGQSKAWTREPWGHDLSQSRMLNHLSHPGTPEIRASYL